MTALDERLRAATDALGEAPRDALPLDRLRRRHQQRRRRSGGAAAVSILVVCALIGVGVRDRAQDQQYGGPAPSTVSSAATRPTSTAAPVDGVRPFSSLPQLPGSALRTVHLSSAIGADSVVYANGSFWALGAEPGCKAETCPWLFRINPASGDVHPISTPPLGSQGAGPIAVGDGAVFVVTYDFDGSPLRIMAVDIATGTKRFSAAIAGTSVSGNPKARLVFADGRVWLSEGSFAVTELDARSGHVVATLPLPRGGGTTSVDAGIAFDASDPQSMLWVAGGDSGTEIIRLDPINQFGAITRNFGTGFTQSVAADGPYVWVTHTTGSSTRVDLVRTAAMKPFAPADTGVPTPQVAAGDGQTWFLGYEPGSQAADPANHYGAVGMVDPRTLAVVGVADLRGITELDTPQLLVADSSAWVFNPTAQTLTRVTSPHPTP